MLKVVVFQPVSNRPCDRFERLATVPLDAGELGRDQVMRLIDTFENLLRGGELARRALPASLIHCGPRPMVMRGPDDAMLQLQGRFVRRLDRQDLVHRPDRVGEVP